MGSEFGTRIRRLRDRCELSQQGLADMAGISRRWLVAIEAGREPRLDHAVNLAEALAVLLPNVEPADLLASVSPTSASAGAIMDRVKRRTFLGRAGAGALGMLTAGPELLTDAIGGGAAGKTSIMDWEDTVLAHGRSTRDRPSLLVLADLSADLAELNQTINDSRSSTTKRELIRVVAQMAGLMCLTYVKLDDRGSFRRWARTARLAAREAGDVLTHSWVRAQEAYGHYYSDDLANAIIVAQDAQRLATGSPCVGAALAAALEARAQAALGHDLQTRVALDRAEGIVSKLPAGHLEPSAFGYNEAQLRFHESSALTHLGDTRNAWEAQDLALALSAPYDYTDRALTNLDRAMCLAQDGHFLDAAVHACRTLTALTEAQRSGIVTIRARRLLAALPPPARTLPAARDLHELTIAVQGRFV